MSHALAGRKQTQEHIAKRVASVRKTKEAWPEERYRLFCERLSISHKGSAMPEEQKKEISRAMKGKQNALGVKRSTEFKKRLSEYWKGNPNHNLRIDGKGYERRGQRMKEMSRLDYRLWRESVFERDSYTCSICGQVGGKLHADHIKPYSLYPESRLDVSNGRTLCKACHKKTESYAWKLTNMIRQCGGLGACRRALEEVDA